MYRFEEHTSEVAMALEATTLPELLVEAGRGVAELMLGALLAAPPGGPQVTVRVEAPDAAALLVAWIDELVFRAEMNKAVFTSFDVRLTGEHAVEADLRGVAEPTLVTAVKAATFHDLVLRNEDGRLRARVVLDV